jgi:DeoR/GlpR family transcriptional regulator of sugar metabolism
MANSDMMTEERQEQIVNLVNERQKITVTELSELFEVSEATIRRDLSALASLNLIRRVHGGAMTHRTVATHETPIIQRQEEQATAKDRIGKAAADSIENGETILLVGGTTGLAVARHLRQHDQLTIVTDSMLIANELLNHNRHKIIMLGGTIDPNEQAVRGALTRIIVAQVQVDKAIIGAKAISVKWGLSAETPEEAELFRCYMEVAHYVIVVTDSTKFQQSALMQVCPVDLIHTLITDDDLDADVHEQLVERGVHVHLC